MTLAESLHNPHWLLMYFVSGWLLGWLATRQRRWALLPGLYTVLLMMVGLSEGLGRIFPSLLGTAFTAGLGLMALWGVSRLPACRCASARAQRWYPRWCRSAFKWVFCFL